MLATISTGLLSLAAVYALWKGTLGSRHGRGSPHAANQSLGAESEMHELVFHGSPQEMARLLAAHRPASRPGQPTTR